MRAGIIEAFPVPNTREDIAEFLNMAAANVESCDNDKEFHAWRAKLDQCSHKARMILSGAASDQADEPAADTADEGDEPAADTDKAETKEAEKEPVASEYKVVVTVADGESAWLEIKNGGETVYADNVVGPEELKYTVTDSLEISTDNTSAVGVTKDGEDVSYDSESGGIGRITVTVPKAASSDKDDASKSDDSDSSASASE